MLLFKLAKDTHFIKITNLFLSISPLVFTMVCSAGWLSIFLMKKSMYSKIRQSTRYSSHLRSLWIYHTWEMVTAHTNEPCVVQSCLELSLMAWWTSHAVLVEVSSVEPCEHLHAHGFCACFSNPALSMAPEITLGPVYLCAFTFSLSPQMQISSSNSSVAWLLNTNCCRVHSWQRREPPTLLQASLFISYWGCCREVVCPPPQPHHIHHLWE